MHADHTCIVLFRIVEAKAMGVGLKYSDYG